MLAAVAELPTAHRLLPFLRLAYGQPGTYLWHDEQGRCREVRQGEGGEQGDALMPALFSLALAGALRRAQERLQPGEVLLAYLDDLYLVTRPERVGAAYLSVTDEVRAHPEGAHRHGVGPGGVRDEAPLRVVWSSD